ncbi:MAG: SH3 domain-containing protein [Candidatus Dojkabacteria bacterium]
MNRNFQKLLIVALMLFLPYKVLAFSFFSSQTQQFDTSLSDQSGLIYTNPKKIYVSQVTTESPSLSRNPSQWVKSLYYYCITRLHFADVPYTYLLDENGIIYQGRTGYIGANPELKNVDGAIVIGYLSNSPSLTSRAVSSLSQMVEEMSHDWGISSMRTIRLNINEEEGKLTTVVAEDTTGEFVTSVADALKEWKGYKVGSLKYKAKIEEVDFPDEAEIGSRVTVKVKLKNTNEFPWFTDKDPIYISVKDGKESKYSINKDWDSFSKPLSINDKVILPSESVELTFNMEARILIGEANEKFELLKFEKQPFEGSGFEVKFKITKGKNTLVKVSSGEYGFANIRECKWFTCKILDSVDNGGIFILLKEEDGWSKVRYGSDTEGWVMSRFLKKI